MGVEILWNVVRDILSLLKYRSVFTKKKKKKLAHELCEMLLQKGCQIFSRRGAIMVSPRNGLYHQPLV